MFKLTQHMRLRVAGLFILFAGMVLSAGTAAGHTIRPAIVEAEVTSDGFLTLTIETNLEAILAEIGTEHDDTDDSPNAQRYNQLRQMPPGQLRAVFLENGSTFLQGINAATNVDGSPLTFVTEDIDIPSIGDVDLARKSVLTLQAVLPDAASQLMWSYPEAYGSNVFRVTLPGSETPLSYWLQTGDVSPVIEITGAHTPPSIWRVMWDYMVIGFTHILPLGLDHILFVLGIFLLSLRLAPLFWQVTAFTIAHTITLGLSIYGLISLSPAIVEPLIAVSIVYVGVENILTRELKPWRVVIVFLFGLLHGMGFAGVLSEIGLPEGEFLTALITFNIGVELGQLAVIALAFLCVGWFRHQPWYRQRIVIPGSLAISFVGAYWAIERVFF